MRVTGVICLCLVVTAVVFAVNSGVLSVVGALVLTSPLTLAGVILIICGEWRLWSVSMIGGATILTLVIVLNSIAPSVAEIESVRDLLRRADERGYSKLPVYARGADDRSAEFYAAGRVVYDSTGEPIALERIPEMREAAQTHGDILVIVPADYVDIVRRLSDMEIIGTNGKVLLIVVHNAR